MTAVTTPGTVRSLFYSTHPVPSLVVAALTTVFAWAVGLTWWQVGVVFFAMLTNQLGIGLGNDWLDASRDAAAGRTDKPLAKGAVSAPAARNGAYMLGVISVGLSALLGPWAVACQVIMLGAGWWYNLHAKSHWSSPISYLLGFGLLPVFPSLALSPPTLPVLWVVAVAGLLGIAAHFANALPDLITDVDNGVRGLPQLMGSRSSGIVMALSVATATVIITVAGSALPLWIRVVTGSLALGTGATATALSFLPTPPRVIFPLVMVSAAVCTVAIAVTFASS